MSTHPRQPVEVIDGIARFKKNAIVEYLFSLSSMNELAAMPFSEEDRIQFAQLIGYSVFGFKDLNYADLE